MGKCWFILWPSVIFYAHLVYAMTIWYILYSFGTFFLVFGKYQEKSGIPAWKHADGFTIARNMYLEKENGLKM
jgi:hypothetical protein